MTCGSASFVRTRQDAWDISLEVSRSTMVPVMENMSNQKARSSCKRSFALCTSLEGKPSRMSFLVFVLVVDGSSHASSCLRNFSLFCNLTSTITSDVVYTRITRMVYACCHDKCSLSNEVKISWVKRL